MMGWPVLCLSVRQKQLLVIASLLLPSSAQRAFKISSTTCSLTADATSCQVASAGDAALQVAFTAGAATSLTLDMSSATTCSATGLFCPQVFMVNSDHSENTVKLSKCAFYKQADYSTHLLTYTFMNLGTAAFTVQDDHGVGRAVVPPGAIRECFCHCAGTCSTATNNRLYCLHISR
ncbi:unnamed protein product [Effrenium voratum]|uniref:Uncharacterized protein n=1 Tax=Effrenium voratum TaxID=2562239 RepID=A0AA36MXG6_9DINO|nr:unnamed protein product [Effrenium voratum]CAJ1387183.1 unnamed protein product [Effrenium voratum]CAJ1456631.1 unnamed protein product [Effrenium voratum]